MNDYFYTWHQSCNCSETFPSTIDDVSSPTTVYVRKNIQRYEREEEIGDGETRTVSGYTYDECRIPVEDWKSQKDVVLLQASVSALEESISDLASIIAEMM